ncbi:MAG: hypothetical protein E3K37_11720 [Candidatus Kuenenia sp.]|nr:hypothetical protein [Candidatus Kuenenia hertensis]
MKNGKRVYSSPAIKGVKVIEPVKPPTHKRQINTQGTEEELLKVKEEEEKLKELELAKERELSALREQEIRLMREEAYKEGKLSAEKEFQAERERLKTEYAALISLFEDAVKQLMDKREKIWKDSESEIINFVLNVANKVVGYEIDENGANVIKRIVAETILHVGDNKIVSLRLSPDDYKRFKSEDVEMKDQNIKIVEDKMISAGGCVVETDFGDVDSLLEIRWEAIKKSLGKQR